MNSLKSKNGNILNTQDEILKETNNHYEPLYRSIDASGISLNDIFGDVHDIPKISEQDKQ